MEKILVTADFSVNSKAGIRYDINLAMARGAEVIVSPCFAVIRARCWSDQKYGRHVCHNEDILMEELHIYAADLK